MLAERARSADLLPLLERAEQLVGSAAVGPLTRQSVVAARRAYEMLGGAPTDREAARWLFVLGSRALAAAVETHLNQLDAPAAYDRSLPTTLLELAAAVSDVSAPPDPPALPGLVGGRLGMSFGLHAPAVIRGEPPIVTERQEDAIAPPTNIGPLATMELPAQRDEEPSPPPPDVPLEGEPEPAEPEEFTIDLIVLPRCAAIAASIARRTEETAAILEVHGLTEVAWSEVELHWAEEIRQDLKRGRTALLAEYDEAYVAQLETERGPITVEEYARIVVAAERGTQQETLAAMGLPPEASIRLQRVWLKKTLQDKALARRLRESIRTCD